MEFHSKFWKVSVFILEDSGDGNQRQNLKTIEQIFDNFDQAIAFSKKGDIKPGDFFRHVDSCCIFEYEVTSVRKLEHKKREIVREVKDVEWFWE